MPDKRLIADLASEIIALESIKPSTLGVVTVGGDLFRLDTQNPRAERYLHLEDIRLEPGLLSFSPGGRYFAYSDHRLLRVLNLETKTLHRSYLLEQQQPQLLMIDPSEHYLLCGTDEGRVFQWRLDSSSVIARLHSFPEYAPYATVKPTRNYVSAFTFESPRFASSGYGGSVVITDLATQTDTIRVHPGHARCDTMLFYDQRYILIGNESGTLLKVDTERRRPHQRIATGLGPLKWLIKIGHAPYVLAASHHKQIALINIASMKIVRNDYITLPDEIRGLTRDAEGFLYIATASGKLWQFDLAPLYRLQSLLESGAYEEAYRYCAHDPLLCQSKAFETLQKRFAEHYALAAHALEKGDKKRAHALMQPFRNAKTAEAQSLFNAFNHFDRLQYLFSKKQYASLYNLADQYPELRATLPYRKLEAYWDKQFLRAQKLMFQHKASEAKDALAPFATVASKAPMVQLLLHHIDIIKAFSHSLKAKEFGPLNTMTRQYPVLREFPSYKALLSETDSMPQRVMEALGGEAFDESDLLITEMEHIPRYHEQSRRFAAYADHAKRLHRALDHAMMRSAFELIDAHHDLLLLPWAQRAETVWHNLVAECEKAAIRGDAQTILESVGTLIDLPQRCERIGNLLRVAYTLQLKQLVGKKDSGGFARGVTCYCAIFGMDTELSHLISIAREHAINIRLSEEEQQHKPRNAWLDFARRLPPIIDGCDAL